MTDQYPISIRVADPDYEPALAALARDLSTASPELDMHAPSPKRLDLYITSADLKHSVIWARLFRERRIVGPVERALLELTRQLPTDRADEAAHCRLAANIMARAYINLPSMTADGSTHDEALIETIDSTKVKTSAGADEANRTIGMCNELLGWMQRGVGAPGWHPDNVRMPAEILAPRPPGIASQSADLVQAQAISQGVSPASVQLDL